MPDYQSPNPARKIVFIYLIAGGLWILLSDKLVALVGDIEIITTLSILKGWLYVGISGILLYYLIDRYLRQLSEARNVLVTAHERAASDLDAMTRLQEIGSYYISEGSHNETLEKILDAAITITGADMGNIQLYDPNSGTLKITVQRGFATDWLDFWETVAEGEGTCGTSLTSMERTIVEDVAQSPIFANTPALEVQLRAGVRGVQSTPILSRTGQLLGMLSTHYRHPGRPEERGLRLLDLVVRQAADILQAAWSDQAIRESEHKYRMLVETTDTGYVVLDEAGRVLDANQEYVRLTGHHDVNDILGRAVTEWTARHDMARNADEVAKCLSQGFVRNLEIDYVTPDGTVTPIEINAAILQDAKGMRIITLCRDISERKQAEEALQEANDLLEARVLERTEALEQANLALQSEVRERLTAQNRMESISLFPEENPSPVLRIASDGIVLYANRAASVLLDTWQCSCGDKVPAILQREIDESLGDARRRKWETESCGRTFLMIIAPFPHKGYANMYGTDISELKQIQQELTGHREHLELLVGKRTTELEIRNLQLASEIEQRCRAEQNLRGYARRIVDMEEELRKRLSAEIHDETGQDLSALGINLAIIRSNLPSDTRNRLKERLDDMEGLIGSISVNIRSLITKLRPPVLDDFGLVAAIRWHSELVAKRSGLAFETRLANIPRLPPEKELALFRIYQEALNNVAKHARAARAETTLTLADQELVLTIGDNGCGFDPAAGENSDDGHWGITIMRERAESIGATLSLESVPDRGTTIRVALKENR